MRALYLPFGVVLMTPPVMLAGINRGGDSGFWEGEDSGEEGGGGGGGEGAVEEVVDWVGGLVDWVRGGTRV